MAARTKREQGRNKTQEPYPATGRKPLPRRAAAFLDAFAATGDVQHASDVSALPLTEANRQRREDAAFQKCWDDAQQQSYAALEAGLVLLARRLVDSTLKGATDEKLKPAGMDAKLAFAILQHSLKKPSAPEEPATSQSDLAQATHRLEGVMARMKLLPVPTSLSDKADPQ